MKRNTFYRVCLVLMLIPLNSFADKGSEKDSIEARYAYTMGYRIGQMLQAQGFKQLDNQNFFDAIDDVLQGNTPRLDEVEMNDAVVSYQKHLKAQRKNDGKANLTEGMAFLEKNKSKPGVMEMASGLQYQVLTTASGLQPGLNDTVEVHYHGTLINGDVFDSSLTRGKAAEFKLNAVIPGFSEALTNMHTGEKWRIFVPSSLAYGEQGIKGSIGPNEVLIFDIELLAIK